MSNRPATPTWWSRWAAGMSPPWPRSTVATAVPCTPSPGASCGPIHPPRRSPRRSSWICGATRRSSTPSGAPSARSSWRGPTGSRSTWSAPRSRDAGREERTTRETATAAYDIDREVWDMAVAEQVKEALGALPDELRQPIELAYFGGRTYREVAVLLDEPEGRSRVGSGPDSAASGSTCRARRRAGGSGTVSTSPTPMSHAEIEELLGAYALDAVEPETAAIIEAHLEDASVARPRSTSTTRWPVCWPTPVACRRPTCGTGSRAASAGRPTSPGTAWRPGWRSRGRTPVQIPRTSR